MHKERYDRCRGTHGVEVLPGFVALAVLMFGATAGCLSAPRIHSPEVESFALSPDNSVLVFSSFGNDLTNRLYAYRLANKSIMPVLAWPDIDLTNPKFASATDVAFLATGHPHNSPGNHPLNSSVWKVNLLTGQTLQLTAWNVQAQDYALMLNGTIIVAHAPPDNRYVPRLDGGPVEVDLYLASTLAAPERRLTRQHFEWISSMNAREDNTVYFEQWGSALDQTPGLEHNLARYRAGGTQAELFLPTIRVREAGLSNYAGAPCSTLNGSLLTFVDRVVVRGHDPHAFAVDLNSGAIQDLTALPFGATNPCLANDRTTLYFLQERYNGSYDPSLWTKDLVSGAMHRVFPIE